MSSAWALAKAEASAATVSLDRGINRLRLQHIKAHSARFRSLRPHAMPDCFLGIRRHQGFELALRPFVVEERAAGIAKERGELGPRVFDELMSTMRMASMSGRGGSALMR